MKEFKVSADQRDQRLDKYIKRILKEAPSSFVYKMLRKKNIKLNDGKADGTEIVKEGDVVRFFLSDETFEKFSGGRFASKADGVAAEKAESTAQGRNAAANGAGSANLYVDACERLAKKISVLYEDDQILLAVKPAGVLSQKAKPEDISLNEWFAGYLIKNGQADMQSLQRFTPSICNRLDRNTSGIVICAKTYLAGRTMAKLLRGRDLHKYYYMVVKGCMEPRQGEITGYLVKSEASNQVFVRQQGTASEYACTRYQTKQISPDKKLSLVEAELVTGKTHQLRAHLACKGHPILGDMKYGDAAFNRAYVTKGVRSQMLHCVRVTFPTLSEPEFAKISGRTFTCDAPRVFTTLMR